MRRLMLIVACIFCVGLGLSQTARAQMQPWEGTYNTEYGQVTFMLNGNQVLAQNPAFNGRLIMSIIRTGLIGGEWVQAQSEQRCARSLHGSFYWGRVQFFFPGNGTVQGLWGYCDQAPTRSWNGRKG